MNAWIKFASLVWLVFGMFLLPMCGVSQTIEMPEIKELVKKFKEDPRGPYQAIRWFCPDGSNIPAQERCQEPGGIQHALPKNVVMEIARQRGIYLGQILAGTPQEAFLDAQNRNSRLKQYQMEKFLQAADDGWILHRARYYRGAIQAEDEDNWGQAFLTELAGNDKLLTSQYYLLRQACKDIPHNSSSDHWQNIRALSKTIGDTLADFTDLRIKLHGQPDPGDKQRVKNFYERYRGNIDPEIDNLLQELLKELEIAYQPFDPQILNEYIAMLPPDSPIAAQLEKLVWEYRNSPEDDPVVLSGKCRDFSELLWIIRSNLLALESAGQRLALLDLSNEIESLVFQTLHAWQPETVSELIEKTFALAQAAAGGGYLEIWEWEAVQPILYLPRDDMEITLAALAQKADYARRVVEWGSGMVRATYQPVVELFRQFEPLAEGFIDDRVRASVLLPLGETASRLNEFSAKISGISNNLIGVKNPGQVQGMNPGFAAGELVVVSGSPDEIEFSAKKIYVLQRAPADLKPVAGIATVTEGNLVSHVQLLARNLGIPNAVISSQTLNDLLPYSGLTVFYAVSPRGSVILKPLAEMNAAEKNLVIEKKRPGAKVTVPLDKLRLEQTNMPGLRELRASNSGELVGPKAANLGELKFLFPDKVVEGFAIPFGVFRQHFDQMMPDTSITYWQFLQDTFREADTLRKRGVAAGEIEKQTLSRLAQLRKAIKTMPFLPDFEEKLRQGFRDHFGVEIGQQPVFIRSDTNMEDLKEFTGAGLNLTVFNVLETERILQGIRDVWASPYTERSYRWRQQYLTNPENVFPSVLMMPTVNVEKSGVMITTGVSTGDARDITVAFSRGPGGAVEGQAAESYLLRADGQNLLLSPSREESYNVLPPTGGSAKGFAHFHIPLLNDAELSQLREIAGEIKQRLASASTMESGGPLDIELGFLDGKIWLFQVRPFVENKRAQSSQYLQNLDPKTSPNTPVVLNTSLGKP